MKKLSGMLVNQSSSNEINIHAQGTVLWMVVRDSPLLICPKTPGAAACVSECPRALPGLSWKRA